MPVKEHLFKPILVVWIHAIRNARNHRSFKPQRMIEKWQFFISILFNFIINLKKNFRDEGELCQTLFTQS